MITFDDNIVNEKFQQLPFEVQRILASHEVVDDIQMIADKNGLLLDQSSTLFNLVTYILLGLIPAKEFVKNLVKEAELKEDVAQKVAEDINTIVLKDIRTTMQQAETKQGTAGIQNAQPTASAPVPSRPDLRKLEEAGGFSIEPHDEQDADMGGDGLTSADKDKILSDVENPAQSKERLAQKEPEETHIEPLVDQLLAAPTGKPEEKIVVAPSNLPVMPAPAVEKAPPPVEQPPKPKGPDPYKEPIQ